MTGEINEVLKDKKKTKVINDRFEIIVDRIDDMEKTTQGVIDEFGRDWIVTPQFSYYLLKRILKDCI